MAAFEHISRLTLQTVGSVEALVDVRTAQLPLQPPESDFDPRKHRTPAQPIKVWMAYFNLLRLSFGPGVLAMPLAISQTGVVFGSILSMVVGLLAVHTHLTLLWCLNEVSRQLKIPHISYRYGFRIALLHGPGICKCIGNHGPLLITIFMVLSQIAICVVFVIFTSDNLRDIMDWETSRPALLVLIIPFLLLESFLRNLNKLSYTLILTNILALSGSAIIFYRIYETPHTEVIYASFRTMNLMFAFGIFLFNCSAVGLILSIDRSIKDPTHLTKTFGIVKVGMLVPTTFATLVGCLGYLSFGVMEENVLRSLAFDETSTMVAMVLYSITVAFAYPLQSYPGILIILEVIKNLEESPSHKYLRLIEHILRIIFVIITFVISYLIPFQGPFVAFAGNLCTIQLSLVFPALMELSLLYPSGFGKYHLYLYKNLIIILVGLACWLVGIYNCGYLIYIRWLSIYD